MLSIFLHAIVICVTVTSIYLSVRLALFVLSNTTKLIVFLCDQLSTLCSNTISNPIKVTLVTEPQRHRFEEKTDPISVRDQIKTTELNNEANLDIPAYIRAGIFINTRL